MPVSAPLVGLSRTGPLDEKLAHRAGGRSEEVRSPAIVDSIPSDEAQIRFVHERRGLKCRTGTFPHEVPRRNDLEFGVDDRRQPVDGPLIVGRGSDELKRLSLEVFDHSGREEQFGDLSILTPDADATGSTVLMP